jgi:hypothetical protein
MSGGEVIALMGLFLVAVVAAMMLPMLLLYRTLARMFDAILERKLAALQSVEEALELPPEPDDEPNDEDIVP